MRKRKQRPLTTDELLACLPGPTGNQTEAKLEAFRAGMPVEELWGMDNEKDGGDEEWNIKNL